MTLLDRIKELSGLFLAQHQRACAALAANDLAALGDSTHQQRVILRQRGLAIDAYLVLRAGGETDPRARETGAR